MRQREPRRGEWIEWVVFGGAALAVCAQLVWIARIVWRALAG